MNNLEVIRQQMIFEAIFKAQRQDEFIKNRRIKRKYLRIEFCGNPALVRGQELRSVKS